MSCNWDELGNKLNSSDDSFNNVYDSNNRLIEDSQNTYTYDPEGNPFEIREKASGKLQRIDWSVSGELLSIAFFEDDMSPPSKIVEYGYGPLGRRIFKKIDGGVVENYHYNGDNIHMVEGALGERLYVHSDQIDRPLLMRKDGEHYNIMTDHLGSTLGLVSEAGDVVEQYAYNAFGEMKIYDGQGAEIPASTLGNIYGFTGREMDSESDFYYYRARYYNPDTGRFLSEDPIGFLGEDLNMYRYVANSPLVYTDPTGLNTFDPALQLGGGGGFSSGGCGLGGSIGGGIGAVITGGIILNQGNSDDADDTPDEIVVNPPFQGDPCNEQFVRDINKCNSLAAIPGFFQSDYDACVERAKKKLRKCRGLE